MKEWAMANPLLTVIVIFGGLFAIAVISVNWASAFEEKWKRKDGDYR